MGQKSVKKTFFKSHPRQFWMLKQVFLAHLQPVVTCFGPQKIPRCFQHGPLLQQNGSRMGQKSLFAKVIICYAQTSVFSPCGGCLAHVAAHGKLQNALKMGWLWKGSGSKRGRKTICPKVIVDDFPPSVMRLRAPKIPRKIPKCFENGLLSEQHMVTKRIKKRCFKIFPRPVGMLEQVFLAHFQPVVMCFGLHVIHKCFENGSFMDRTWVKNGSKRHFPQKSPGPFGMLMTRFQSIFEFSEGRSASPRAQNGLQTSV